MSKKLPIIILRIFIIFLVVVGILLSVFFLPEVAKAITEDFPNGVIWKYPLVTGLYAMIGCLFWSLWQFWFLLTNITRSHTFAVRNLKSIRLSAIVFIILYCLFAMPIIFWVGDSEDAPGVILIGASFNMFPLSIASGVTILERMCMKYR